MQELGIAQQNRQNRTGQAEHILGTRKEFETEITTAYEELVEGSGNSEATSILNEFILQSLTERLAPVIDGVEESFDFYDAMEEINRSCIELLLEGCQRGVKLSRLKRFTNCGSSNVKATKERYDAWASTVKDRYS